jgi:hypothetical protein
LRFGVAALSFEGDDFSFDRFASLADSSSAPCSLGGELPVVDGFVAGDFAPASLTDLVAMILSFVIGPIGLATTRQDAAARQACTGKRRARGQPQSSIVILR